MKNSIILLVCMFFIQNIYGNNIKLNHSNEESYGVWKYTTIELSDSCTRLNGVFYANSDCYIYSNLNEYMYINGKDKYLPLYTSLPEQEYPRVFLSEGDTVVFCYIYAPLKGHIKSIEIPESKISHNCDIQLGNNNLSLSLMINCLNDNISRAPIKKQLEIFDYTINHSYPQYTSEQLNAYRKQLNDVFLKIISTIKDGDEKYQVSHYIDYHRIYFMSDATLMSCYEYLTNINYNFFSNTPTVNSVKENIDKIEAQNKIFSLIGKKCNLYLFYLKQLRSLILYKGEPKSIDRFDQNTIKELDKLYSNKQELILALESLTHSNGFLLPSDNISSMNPMYSFSIDIDMPYWKKIEESCNNNASIHYWKSLLAKKSSTKLHGNGKVQRELIQETDSLFRLYANDWFKHIVGHFDIAPDILTKIFHSIEGGKNQELATTYAREGDFARAAMLWPDNVYYQYKVRNFEQVKSITDIKFNEYYHELGHYLESPLILDPTLLFDNNFFWSSYLERTYPFYCLALNDSNMSCNLYNSILMCKTYKLLAQQTFSQIMEKIDDKGIKNEWKEINASILQYKSSGFKNLGLEKRDSLLLQERIFFEKCKQSNILRGYSYPKWEDIQSSLPQQSVAIEFKEIITDKEPVYVALTITPNCKSPIITRLCNKAELDSLHIYSATGILNRISKLIWEPLQSTIKEYKNLYISLDGVLHALPIESAISLCDSKIRVCRLTSSRELYHMTKNNETRENKDNITLLLGGLHYKTSNNNGSSITESNRGNLSDISKQTLEEVMAIDSICKEKSYKSVVVQGMNGTKRLFHRINGSDITVLHLSTHGQYQHDQKDYTFSFDEKEYLNREDKMLNKSFLYLSGATAVSTNNIMNDDDFILTGFDVSKLNFPHLDLVVLSACQTAIGDVDGSEGMYGLHRAFKKAGAKSIIASLWKIDDRATKEFMVEFYRNYINGKSKMDSFINAQQHLKNYQINGLHPYDNPFYWAAFVLIDAI